MPLVLSLTCPTCALPSSLYLSPWAAPWGAPHSQVPLWCHVRQFARKSHLGKDGKDKKINFHWPSDEPRVFARKLWWLSVVCGGSCLGLGRMELQPWACGLHRGLGLGCVLGLLAKALDPLPESRRAACLCFCGLSVPTGPSTVPAGKEAGGHQQVTGEPPPTPTQAHNQDVKLGCSGEEADVGPRHACPASPLFQPPLLTSSQVSAPLGGDRCFQCKTSQYGPPAE